MPRWGSPAPGAVLRRGCYGWGLEPCSASPMHPVPGGGWEGWGGGHSSWKKRAGGWDCACPQPSTDPIPILVTGTDCTLGTTAPSCSFLPSLSCPRSQHRPSLHRAAPSLPPSCPPPLPSLCLNPFPWACPWQRTPFCSFCWIHKRKEGTKKNKREAKQPYSQLPPSAARVSDEEGGFYATGANCLNKTGPSLPIGPSCA